jgi:hypothetical protein
VSPEGEQKKASDGIPCPLEVFVLGRRLVTMESHAVVPYLAGIKLLENKSDKRLFLFEIGKMCYMFGGSLSTRVL